jgi:hypothetical protein
MNLFKIASRVVTAVSGETEFYRLITDEPQGVCVGFRPPQELLDEMSAELDESWRLVADDRWGSDTDTDTALGVVVLVNSSKNDVIIRRDPLTNEERSQGMSELGPDLYIWRSEDELRKWWNDSMNG